MNRFGMILSELGFGGLLRELSERLVAPLGVQLFPEWVAARSSRSTVPRLSRTAAKILPAWNVGRLGARRVSHPSAGPAEACRDLSGPPELAPRTGASELPRQADDCLEQYGFSVEYSLGGDRALAEHSDTANVTLNVCLGREFAGGELYFKGVRFTPSAEKSERDVVAHRPGWALLHLGGHVHCATPLEAGERVNLILWCQGEHGTVRIRPVTGSKLSPLTPGGAALQEAYVKEYRIAAREYQI